jgi:hypothetical protein
MITVYNIETSAYMQITSALLKFRGRMGRK